MFRTSFHRDFLTVWIIAEIKCHHDYGWNKHSKTKTGGKWECFLDINLKIKPTEYSLGHMHSKVQLYFTKTQRKSSEEPNQEVVAQTKGMKNYNGNSTVPISGPCRLNKRKNS